MAVSAKMRCTKREETTWGSHEPGRTKVNAVNVRLDAYRGVDEENVDWSQYTPSGHIELVITNPEAYGQFETGAIYSITLAKAKNQD